MSESKLQQLNQVGQSPWLDYIRRDMLENGELADFVNQGVRGVTSNPTIFENAIAKSSLYQSAIERLARAGNDATAIYDALAFADIRMAADILAPVYEATQGADGFVSLEVPPDLCDDHEQTIQEARRIWKEIQRPNLMIKVPATTQGMLAVTQLISEGINVNVTLMFTQQDYRDVAEAYLVGLERRLEHGGDLHAVASVASVFVSRIDAAVEGLTNGPLREQLLGKVAVANTRLIYRIFKEVFASPRFQRLKEHGARVQRPLWASTGVKNKDLSDVLYVNEIIGADTVNTMPPATLTAFADHGTPARTVDQHDSEDDAIIDTCHQHNIDLHAIGIDLQQKGLKAFTESFDHLMDAIETVRRSVTI